MASLLSKSEGASSGAPNLNLSPEEKRVYGLLFHQADTEGVGVVTGEIAVQFFEKTRLDSRILGEIWQIADRENRGFLEATGFGVALRLIGHAQASREPTPDLALQQGPLPKFDGINIGPAPAPAPLQQQASGTVPIRIPPLTPEKVSQYAAIFENQSLQNGLLAGGPAKTIFEKSQLPNEVLGRIWQLADTEQRGGLVLTEFVIAMHLLTSMKTGALRALPNILPAPLYEAATRRAPSTSRQSPTLTGPTVSAIPRQLSGSAQPRTSSPLGRPPLGAQGIGIGIGMSMGIPPQTTGGDWLITPGDKTKYDQFYADLDKTNKGYITGEEAVPFLSQSKLSEDSLAQIWDLADINSEGRLTKDSFAVAMYLIRQQRTKGGPLPASLPPSLVPPSFRNRMEPSPFGPPASASTPTPPQPPPQPKSALDDLFGLDASPSPVAASGSLSPQGTGVAAKMTAGEGFAGAKPSSPIQSSPTGNTFKPFIPSSSFGKTLTAQDTGGSGTSSQAARGLQPSNMEDLLGDNDPEISKKLTNESAELANLSNQIGSLSKQMQQVQGQRSTTQNEINQASEQKRNFEQRLSQLRTLYEKEAKDVRVLEEQLKAIREDTRKLTNEMVSIDGNYQDFLRQHRQLSQALQGDQQENATLKQRISVVNSEIAQLKPQIEKLKSEARQQKGLVAINKKQLAALEGDRDKLQTEADDLSKSNEELSRQVSAGSPIPAPAQVASPTPSTTSANNPFFRRTGSSDIMGAFSSPPAKSYNERSVEDIFGGFIPGTSPGTPPPIKAFKNQNTGNSSASIGSPSTPVGSSPTASRQGTSTVDPSSTSESHQSNLVFPFGEAPESLAAPRRPASPYPNALEPTITGQSTTSASDANQSLTSVHNESKDTVPIHTPAASAFSDGTQTPSAPITTFHNHRDSDLFPGMNDTGNAKIDFDSAFASFPNSSSKSQENSTKDFVNKEFPPISELERDDESDSASEGNRFDDDFTPVSPPRKGTSGSNATNAPSSPNATKSTAASPGVSAAENTVTKNHTPQPSNLSGLSAFPEPPKLSPSLPSPTKSGSPFAPTPSTTANTAPVATKSAFDELDDDFEGLEDAKEGSADDEFANVSRSNLDDFNPVFDSSPPPSQPRTEPTNVSSTFGTESSYDFGNISSASAGTASATPVAATSTTAGSANNPTPPNNDEWDRLFTDLPPAKDSTTEKGTEERRSPAQNLSPERPSFSGRALTDEGKHDDPMVKNLTGMGYSRADAVNALEKYDYNLERAANHLASQP
ncbi:putative UBA TS-N domain-containing protein [Rosellinia necatrix]|uniref:Putative UBA TS-N domain-containing protein n=1 Tax=Rosellinia necatrix TaxID=77044 RepID=A0A1S7UKI3_ROSNE|nr:putative UBA TS-N domain-containing protein [Rosellinia necatrix]